MDNELKAELKAINMSIKALADVNDEQHKGIIRRLDITNGNIKDLESWKGGAEIEIAKNTYHRSNVQKYWKFGFVIVILLIWLSDYVGLQNLIDLIK